MADEKRRRVALVIDLNPAATLSINDPAVARLLGRVLEERVGGNQFLRDCGITIRAATVDESGVIGPGEEELVIKEVKK